MDGREAKTDGREERMDGREEKEKDAGRVDSMATQWPTAQKEKARKDG